MRPFLYSVLLVVLGLWMTAMASPAQAPPRVAEIKAQRTAVAGAQLTHYRANPLTLRLTLDATRPALTGAETLAAEIRHSVLDTTTALARVELANPTGSGPFDLAFTGAQLNQDLGGAEKASFWLVVYVLADSGETLDVLATVPLVLREHGASLTTPAPPNVVGVLTRAAADALYTSLAATNTLAARVTELEDAPPVDVSGLVPATRTVNGQPLSGNVNITSVTGAAGSAPAGTLTGSTINPAVTGSSLTSLGTLGTLNVTGTAHMGQILRGFPGGTDARVSLMSKTTWSSGSPDALNFNALILKSAGGVTDPNIEGGVMVYHDLAYAATPGYGGVNQVYSLAGGNGLALGSNTYSGFNRNATYAPGPTEEANTNVRIELGPIWPRSEAARWNNGGDYLQGFQELATFTASQSGTTVTAASAPFRPNFVGRYLAWSSYTGGGAIPHADRITAYISPTQVTVERSRTIAAQAVRYGLYSWEVSPLGQVRANGQRAEMELNPYQGHDDGDGLWRKRVIRAVTTAGSNTADLANAANPLTVVSNGYNAMSQWEVSVVAYGENLADYASYKRRFLTFQTAAGSELGPVTTVGTDATAGTGWDLTVGFSSGNLSLAVEGPGSTAYWTAEINQLAARAPPDALPPVPWSPADLAVAPVAWIKADALKGTFADGANITGLTDLVGTVFASEQGHPVMRYNQINGKAGIEMNVAQSTAGLRTTGNVTAGYPTMIAVWKSADNGTSSPFPQLYAVHAAGSAYSDHGTYLYGYDAVVLHTRNTSTARAYLMAASTPAGGLNVWQTYLGGYKAGVGPWAEIDGVAVPGSVTGNAPNGTYGNSLSAPFQVGGGRFNNGTSDPAQRSKGVLAEIIFLGYEATPTELQQIRDYLTEQYGL